MAESPSVADDIAQVDRWLAQPDCGFAELKRDLDFLRSVAQTRDFLVGMREGLEDVRDGRTIPHEEVVRRSEERLRRRRLDAAE